MRIDKDRRRRAVLIAGILGFILGSCASRGFDFVQDGNALPVRRSELSSPLGLLLWFFCSQEQGRRSRSGSLVAVQLVLLTGILIETFTDARITQVKMGG